MPGTVQHSSSDGFVFFKHPLLASRSTSQQPQLAPLTAYPPSSMTAQSRSGALVGEERPLRGVGQDKGASDDAPESTTQPAPVTKVARSSARDTSAGHTSLQTEAKERKVRASVWLQPRVRLAMLHIAELEGDSFSAACDTALEVFSRQKIHDQQEALFEPRFRKIVREENRSLGDRLVIFEMRNAIAAEQTRILITDLYKRQLQKEGLTKKKIEEKVDQAYNLARSNVLKKTPQLATLLDAWWNEADASEGGERKAGIGKTHT
jgi:hypothetical protein